MNIRKKDALPENIHTVDRLKNHLCYRGSPKTEICVECESRCRYGERLMELTGVQVRRETSDFKRISRCGECAPNLKTRLSQRERDDQ